MGDMSYEERLKFLKEARGSFFGRGVEVLKLQSRIQDQLRSPSYYIIISTYDQRLFLVGFQATTSTIAMVAHSPFILNNVDYLEI